MPAWSRAILTLFARGDMRPLTGTYVTRLDPAAMCSDDEAAKSTVGIARDANGMLPIAGDGQVKIEDVDGSIMVNTERTAGGFCGEGRRRGWRASGRRDD